MPFTPISAAPNVPNSGDPLTSFDADYEAFYTWEKNTLQPGVNAAVVEITAQAGTASDAAAVAQTAASAAADYAASAINAPGTSATSTTSLTLSAGTKFLMLDQTGKAFGNGQQVKLSRAAVPTTRQFGTITAFNAGTGAMTVEVASGAVEGTGGPYTDWEISLGVAVISATPPERKVRTITGADTVVTADRQKLIRFTGAADATLAITAAGTLGDGFFCYVQNATQFDLTLDPAGAELVDGLSSYPMYPGELRELRGNGTALATIVINPYRKVWPASGTWVKTPGYVEVDGYVHSGGQGGRRGATGSSRNGGPGGARALFRFLMSQLSATEAVVVGSGGAAATADNTNGGAGGNSSFHGVVATGASGNSPGSAYGSTTNPATMGAIPNSAEASQQTAYLGGANSTTGTTVYGGGAGDSISSGNALQAGATTMFGGPGGTTNAAGTAPTAGQVPGGGGGASTNGTNSGLGARGEVVTQGVI